MAFNLHAVLAPQRDSGQTGFSRFKQPADLDKHLRFSRWLDLFVITKGLYVVTPKGYTELAKEERRQHLEIIGSLTGEREREQCYQNQT